MIDICQNVRGHMGTYYQLMKEEDFVPGGFIPSLNVIPKTELTDLLYDESEIEVEDFFFKKFIVAINCGYKTLDLLW